MNNTNTNDLSMIVTLTDAQMEAVDGGGWDDWSNAERWVVGAGLAALSPAIGFSLGVAAAVSSIMD